MKQGIDKVLGNSSAILQALEKEWKTIIGSDELIQNFTRMIASGSYTKKKICQSLAISDDAYDRLLRLETVQNCIKEYTHKQEELMNMRMGLMVNKAIDTMQDVLENGEERNKIAVAKDILDRTGYKAKEQKDVNVSISYEQNVKLFRDMGIDMDNIPDVDFEEVE